MKKPEELRFRRQYLVGPEEKLISAQWRKEPLSDNLIISHHRDIECSVSRKGDMALACLGFILDPFHPRLNNEEVLSRILDQSRDFTSAIEEINKMGGRFVLILKIDREIYALNDAAGFRQIFHYRDRSGRFWIASQPAIFQQVFTLESNSELVEDIKDLFLFTRTEEYWYPGTKTLFKGVSHLTANHCFHMITGQVQRFWPLKKIGHRSLQDAVSASATILGNLIEAALARYDVAFGITCGLDSRTLLSLCREHLSDIYFFSHTHEHLDIHGNDITIPRAILEKAGAAHQIVFKDNQVEENFSAAFDEGVTGARKFKKEIAFTLHKHFEEKGKDFLVLNGVCSELIRHFYNFPGGFEFNGKKLAVLAYLEGSAVAEQEFQRWLDEAAPYLDKGIEVTELFYWENRNSNWAAMSYHEYDIAFDSFSPFNCRYLLETILGIKKRYRKPPYNPFHREIIKANWKELLNYPINPRNSSNEKISYFLQVIGLFNFLKFLKYQYKFSKK